MIYSDPDYLWLELKNLLRYISVLQQGEAEVFKPFENETFMIQAPNYERNELSIFYYNNAFPFSVDSIGPVLLPSRFIPREGIRSICSEAITSINVSKLINEPLTEFGFCIHCLEPVVLNSTVPHICGN